MFCLPHPPLTPEAYKALEHVVFSILYDDAARGHTVDSLIDTLRRMGMFHESPYVLGNAVRVHLASLVQSGDIEMRPDGKLVLPAEEPEFCTYKFLGSWFSV